MAAVLHPTTVPLTTVPLTTVGPAARPAARPALRVIEGGRSPAGRAALAATYRRRRIGAALVLVSLLALAWVLGGVVVDLAADAAAPSGAAISGPTVTVVAEPGDTLWTLAREARPAGDVRPAVEAMIAERGGSDLEVGDRVRVPVG